MTKREDDQNWRQHKWKMKHDTRLPGAEPQPIRTILFLNCIELGCC